MAGPQPVFNQINIVCSDVDASLVFYRRLGVTIPEGTVWRTATGAHHVGPIPGDAADTPSIDLDSAAFARFWNIGWKDRDGIAGRVAVGLMSPISDEHRSPETPQV